MRQKQPKLDLAVAAWKALWLETTTREERLERVWKPTMDLLDKLSLKPPKAITCFCGDYYVFPANSRGIVLDIYFVGANRAAYLGTLFDKTANQVDRKQEIARLALLNKELSKKLKRAGAKAIVRDAHFCKIPADADELNFDTATLAVKRYLGQLAPQLTGCEIKWLSPESGIALWRQIESEATRTARQQTQEERLRIKAEDELELW